MTIVVRRVNENGSDGDGRGARVKYTVQHPCNLDDRGSVAVLVCYIVLISAALLATLIDAGTAIQAANKADTYSSEAARAASIAVGPVPTDSTTATEQAAAAARSYLAHAGVACSSGCVSVVGPATVQVTVTVTENTPMLGISVSQTRSHTAQLQIGVTNGEVVS